MAKKRRKDDGYKSGIRGIEAHNGTVRSEGGRKFYQTIWGPLPYRPSKEILKKLKEKYPKDSVYITETNIKELTLYKIIRIVQPI
ncbi:MAG: hypothetical protein Fur0024_3040 [Patescibacteria group bacterium]